MERMGTGLLVTSLIGQGVNLTTGDYSLRGAKGFWVENGKIKLIRWTESPSPEI